jgi:hypothetical protein
MHFQDAGVVLAFIVRVGWVYRVIGETGMSKRKKKERERERKDEGIEWQPGWN